MALDITERWKQSA